MFSLVLVSSAAFIPDSNERGRQVTPGAEVDSGKSKAVATSFVLIPKIKSKTNREGTPEKNIFSDLFRNEVSHPHTPDIEDSIK